MFVCLFVLSDSCGFCCLVCLFFKENLIKLLDFRSLYWKQIASSCYFLQKQKEKLQLLTSFFFVSLRSCSWFIRIVFQILQHIYLCKNSTKLNDVNTYFSISMHENALLFRINFDVILYLKQISEIQRNPTETKNRHFFFF